MKQIFQMNAKEIEALVFKHFPRRGGTVLGVKVYAEVDPTDLGDNPVMFVHCNVEVEPKPKKVEAEVPVETTAEVKTK